MTTTTRTFDSQRTAFKDQHWWPGILEDPTWPAAARTRWRDEEELARKVDCEHCGAPATFCCRTVRRDGRIGIRTTRHKARLQRARQKPEAEILAILHAEASCIVPRRTAYEEAARLLEDRGVVVVSQEHRDSLLLVAA